MNNKMTTKSQLLASEPKKNQQKQMSKQLEQEQNHRNGDHMEGYQQASARGERGERYRE